MLRPPSIVNVVVGGSGKGAGGLCWTKPNEMMFFRCVFLPLAIYQKLPPLAPLFLTPNRPTEDSEP